jgi:hypothetical protein
MKDSRIIQSLAEFRRYCQNIHKTNELAQEQSVAIIQNVDRYIKKCKQLKETGNAVDCKDSMC